MRPYPYRKGGKNPGAARKARDAAKRDSMLGKRTVITTKGPNGKLIQVGSGVLKQVIDSMWASGRVATAEMPPQGDEREDEMVYGAAE
ncbi:hypothetical protein VSDG_08636 [Cytospora chrysosperma]|uniref:Uncharacterized protein n=1 Tax=Cytospora chrysosperma TaxID=252740 RepID=A0A423VEK8_CYTCH|nr:hypothetical protein VSDG_08636 [Valsa sordida]